MLCVACVSPDVIKLIDFLYSITRVGLATVTFGRKCQSTLHDVSEHGLYFGAFFQYQRRLSSTPAEQLTQQNMSR